MIKSDKRVVFLVKTAYFLDKRPKLNKQQTDNT